MDLVRIYVDTQNKSLAIDISPWLLIGAALLIVVGVLIWRRFRRYELVKLDIPLGGIGVIELRPNTEDLQIAHRVWTELVTRKAAIPIDPDHDVLVEIYDSWHVLFATVRQLIADVPADLIRREKSTRALVHIATETLNKGLRPHLTCWQARLRNWWESNQARLQDTSPQDLQKEFPGFDELVEDMLVVNRQLIDYADELSKLRDG